VLLSEFENENGIVPHNSLLDHGPGRDGRHDETHPGGLYLKPYGSRGEMQVVNANGDPYGSNVDMDPKLQNALEQIGTKNQKIRDLQLQLQQSEIRAAEAVAYAVALQQQANVTKEQHEAAVSQAAVSMQDVTPTQFEEEPPMPPV
jgi:hypothetical protein